jgi:Protein of unknown function (DUF2934)
MDEREENRRLERIRQRAYQLWQAEGCPEGRADVHWDQATELVAIEDNQRFATEPVPSPDDLGPSGEPIEPIEAVENAGEFPTTTDQGEQAFPSRRKVSNASVQKASQAPATTTGSSPKRGASKRGIPEAARTVNSATILHRRANRSE